MELPTLRGRVAWIFDQESFDIDQVVGVKNIKVRDMEELARVAMAAYDPGFAKKVRPGDLIVGAGNFGYGHPHYPPIEVLRHFGISGIVAESFAPLYWMIQISDGFPQVACPDISRNVSRWDEVEVDWKANVVRNLTQATAHAMMPMSTKDKAVLAAGGIVPYLKHSNANG
jgi:3-isopropylmalate/(R)-2-methylmalate dehydratase small subunit